MTLDDQSLFDWAFKGIVGLFVTILTWMAGKQMKATEKNAEAITEHRIYSEGTYIKNDALNRVHLRIDEGNKQTAENFNNIHKEVSEIKTILINGKK